MKWERPERINKPFYHVTFPMKSNSLSIKTASIKTFVKDSTVEIITEDQFDMNDGTNLAYEK